MFLTWEKTINKLEFQRKWNPLNATIDNGDVWGEYKKINKTEVI